MSTIPARFAISPEEIDLVVAKFYARIRAHETLGPVFAAHVSDWPVHEAKIAGFWKKAILHEPGYDGNPMLVHHRAQDVRSAHFALWLELFDRVLADELRPETAASWSMLAHRIGRGLRLGIETRDAPAGAVPMLR